MLKFIQEEGTQESVEISINKIIFLAAITLLLTIDTPYAYYFGLSEMIPEFDFV